MKKRFWCDHPPWGIISHFLPLHVSLVSALTLEQNISLKKKKEIDRGHIDTKKQVCTPFVYVSLELQALTIALLNIF